MKKMAAGLAQTTAAAMRYGSRPSPRRDAKQWNHVPQNRPLASFLGYRFFRFAVQFTTKVRASLCSVKVFMTNFFPSEVTS